MRQQLDLIDGPAGQGGTYRPDAGEHRPWMLGQLAEGAPRRPWFDARQMGADGEEGPKGRQDVRRHPGLLRYGRVAGAGLHLPHDPAGHEQIICAAGWGRGCRRRRGMALGMSDVTEFLSWNPVCRDTTRGCDDTTMVS